MIIVNILGAPSSGKTSLAARLFSKLKELSLNVEFAQEAAKVWCLEGKEIGKYGQFYLFGVECHKQSRLFGSVDIVLSDASPVLAAFYNYYYSQGDNCLSPACKEFYRRVAEDGIKVVNFFLPRKKKYVAKGRYQTEAQADQLAIDLKNWLDNEGYEYTELQCADKDRLDFVIDKLRDVVENFDGMAMV